jgi:hypothetical protein
VEEFANLVEVEARDGLATECDDAAASPQAGLGGGAG